MTTDVSARSVLPTREGIAVTGTVADLAEPAVLVPARATAAQLDRVFRRDASLRCVVIDVPDAPVLVERSWYESLMSGPLGYGRVLHARRVVAEVAPHDGLVVGADAQIAATSTAVIEHSRTTTMPEVVVVTWPDGTLGTLRTARLFERMARHFAHQSMHDALTGLPNRTHLTSRLHEAEATGETVALVFIDLDRFKAVNDGHGHLCGDQVIAQFGSRLRDIVRTGDVAARLGGDEFAVLRVGDGSLSRTIAMAERLLVEASVPYDVDPGDGTGPRTVSIGASIGVSHAPPADLMRDADAAMYLAKQRGGAQVAVNDARGSTATSTLTFADRLRDAVERDQIEVHVQPVVDLAHDRVVGHEALARWHDGERQVPPVEFIAVAERTGLVVELGRRVLVRACRVAAAHDEPTVMSVNVSPVQLTDPGFVEEVAAVLRDTGLDPARLCLEITETAAVSDLAATAEQLRRLREHGVLLALDDFGTGYSSLTLLRRLPVDVLKVDRSFIGRIGSDRSDAVIVRLIIEAAHALGLRVCAEGVEEQEQRDVLLQMRCDIGQGWLFGRPARPVSPR